MNNQDKLNIRITLTTPILGSLPGNKQIFTDHKADKIPTGDQIIEEIECIEEVMEKATTIFPKNEKGLFIWDYQFKGFLKESISVMVDLGTIALSKYIYKRVVDSSIFITPRQCFFKDKDGNPILDCKEYFERPLRATTMQGDRIALARSQILPEGIYFDAEITHLKSTNTKSKFEQVDMDKIKEALDYGKFKGLGQFRNGGYGSFEWKEIK